MLGGNAEVRASAYAAGMEDVDGPGLVPKLVLGGIAVFVVLTVIGWVVGALLSLLRLAVVVAVAVGVIWAIGSARAGRT